MLKFVLKIFAGLWNVLKIWLRAFGISLLCFIIYIVLQIVNVFLWEAYSYWNNSPETVCTTESESALESKDETLLAIEYLSPDLEQEEEFYEEDASMRWEMSEECKAAKAKEALMIIGLVLFGTCFLLASAITLFVLLGYFINWIKFKLKKTPDFEVKSRTHLPSESEWGEYWVEYKEKNRQNMPFRSNEGE